MNQYRTRLYKGHIIECHRGYFRITSMSRGEGIDDSYYTPTFHTLKAAIRYIDQWITEHA